MNAPVCLIHGEKLNEHLCLYCCVCFKPLTLHECHRLPNGELEDMCLECAEWMTKQP